MTTQHFNPIDAPNINFLVQKRIREIGPEGFKARVVDVKLKDDAIHKAQWWLIQIEINIRLEELYQYHELLNAVEEKLLQEDGLNTLLVPHIPEEQAA